MATEDIDGLPDLLKALPLDEMPKECLVAKVVPGGIKFEQAIADKLSL